MYARVRHSLNSLSFWKKFVQLNLGLTGLGLGIALMLAADIGVGPWTVFHEGVSLRSGLSFGRVIQLTGLLVIALGYVLTRIKPGFGTLLNMVLVGVWVDLFAAWLPDASGLFVGTLLFLLGVSCVGLASGLYISAELGAGPRDGLVLGLSRSLNLSVRKVRFGLELLVLISGFLLGGSVGLGTVLFALLIGPLMQFALRLFGSKKVKGHKV